MFRWGNYDTVNAATLNCTAASTPIAACPADQRADAAPTYPGLSSPSTTFPPSFYFSSAPSWWTAGIPFPAIGSDVTGGNLGIVGGSCINTGGQSCSPAINGTTYGSNTTSSSWAAHVNAPPAANCFLTTMAELPDGTGSMGTFNASSCYVAALSSSWLSTGNYFSKGSSVQ